MAPIGDIRQARSRVPHLHCIIPGARGDTSAIGRPGHRIYETHMAVVGQSIAFRSRFPYLHCIVPGARGDTSAIGRPGHGTHISGMAAISEDVAFRSRIHYLRPLRHRPYLDGFIAATGGNELTVGRPRDSKHVIGMTTIDDRIASRGSIPHLHCLVFAGGGDAAIVKPSFTSCTWQGPYPPDRIPCNSIHRRRMAAIDEVAGGP